jgi:hypothetical protein
MSRFQWNTKDIREDRDASDSNLSTVSRSSPEVTHLGEWTTSRRELLCFYLYSIVRFSLFFCTFFPIFYRRPKGNNGLAGFRFGPSQIQNLLYFAGHDLSQPPFAKPCSSGSNCVLPFLGHVRNSSSFSHRPHLRYSSMGLYIILLWVVNSIILLTNGICFAIQAVMLLMIGAWADYGTWRCAGARIFPRRLNGHRPLKNRPNILIFFTILSAASSFAWLGVQEPSQWPGGIVLYLLNSKCYPIFRPFRVSLSQ